jgi:hypothetical protein
VAHDVLSVARMRSATAANKWLRRESNPHRAGLQPAALPVSYKSPDEADGTRTRNLPRDSRARSPLRHGFKDFDARHQQWLGERMTPPPGSRVISCETAIRPPAIANGPRLLRHTCIHRLSKSRSAVPKRRSPHPASCAQVGRSRIPFGRRTWTSDLTAPGRSLPPARCCPAHTMNPTHLRRVDPSHWVGRRCW